MSEFLTFFRMAGQSIMLGISFVLVIILSFVNCKKHKLSKISTLLFIIFGYAGAILCARLMGELYTLVSVHFGGAPSRIAIFGTIAGMPIFAYIALIFGKPWREVADLFSPGVFLALAFAKFGCFLTGCCPGIECDFGVYNSLHDKIMFPSQVVESITMIVIVLFCYWYNYGYKNKVVGTTYPVTAIVYSITRFFFEYLRYYDIEELRHLFLGMSFWQLWCIAIAIYSVALIVIMKRPKHLEYENLYYEWHAKQVEKLKAKIKKKEAVAVENDA